MRKLARKSHLVRCGVLVALVVCVALSLTAAALAAGGSSVKSHFWRIGINDGPEHKVAAGGTFKYCASKTVGAITPDVVLSAPMPAGEESSFGIVGPAAAGASLETNEGPSTGEGTVIDPAFIPLTFPKLKAQDASSFPPGTYSLTLTVGGATALTQKVKLVRRSGC
ncbi:MAG TPA: hypothetical protein VIJ33_03105 [Solirubrobacteraceae bacterium]